MLNTTRLVIGDYGQQGSAELLRATAGEQHPTGLADLDGARMVTVSEVAPSGRWNGERVKGLTGGDPIRARFMRQNFFEFRPQCKLWLMANHKLRLRGADRAWRRRLLFIPLLKQVPDLARIDGLAEIIATEEGPAVLRWLIDGAVEWAETGLRPPEYVVEAGEEYFAEADALARWFVERIEWAPGARLKRVDAWRDWEKWATSAGERPGRAAELYDALRARGDLNEIKVRGDRYYDDVRLTVVLDV
ncbi:MAG: phage/plasmid primase, P4 family [Rhodospirillales bacterium]